MRVLDVDAEFLPIPAGPTVAGRMPDDNRGQFTACSSLSPEDFGTRQVLSEQKIILWLFV